MRPPAILYFERLYLASLGLSVIGWAISWPVLSARMAADPRTAGFGWLLPAGLALSVAISLALWFFVARRASRIARTIAVVLTALSVLRLLLNLPAMLNGAMPPLAAILSIATVALGVMAVMALYRPDARSWFGEDFEGDAA
ncbi:hypothetical protein [uncultured Sphingomonas sp.]|uniref:hypothetical protein n=1 Tax=uncultured Sphingomonas sp. TaxID=158754 RepID=UPI0030DD6C74